MLHRNEERQALPQDRERRHTARAVLSRIDDDTEVRLRTYAEAGPTRIAERLRELDREWDTDRAIELEAATMGLTGLALGTLVRPAFFAIPGIVGAAVLVHAVTGWYPLLPVFRRLGVRTSREIERERYALKALRGDFVEMSPDGIKIGTDPISGPWLPSPPPVPASSAARAPRSTT